MTARRSVVGFTLLELVVVVVIATILSAFAFARINTQSFDTEGFANRVAAMVRYAQKIAVAQRRVVFVVTTASNVRLCYTDASCATPVHEPPGTNDFSYDVPSSSIALSVASISFTALGSSAGGSITVTGDGTKTITVIAETGYVQYVP